jgi:hypothetical protein
MPMNSMDFRHLSVAHVNDTCQWHLSAILATDALAIISTGEMQIRDAFVPGGIG